MISIEARQSYKEEIVKIVKNDTAEDMEQIANDIITWINSYQS